MGSDHDEDEDERRFRSRERNKEHARKTRARKKEQLETLRAQMDQLEEEGRLLKQSIHECGVASILLGLSGTSGSPCLAPEAEDEMLSTTITSASSLEADLRSCQSGNKRMRFLSLDEEEPLPQMELNIRGQVTLVGGTGRDGKTQINWKTGVYVDEKCIPQQLTATELEALRRERNRMHAKMTRDRKRCFIASLKRVISKLEEKNQHLRDTLEKYHANENKYEGKRTDLEDNPSVNPPVPASSNNTYSSAFSAGMYTIG